MAKKAADGMRLQWSGLQARTIGFLSLALLPIGLIAIIQTTQIERTAARTAENALLVRSEQAARQEITVIRRALAATATLSHVAPEMLADVEVCRRIYEELFAQVPAFASFSVVPRGGEAGCTSSSAAASGISDVLRDRDDRRLVLSSVQNSEGSDALLVAMPYGLEGGFDGFVAITLHAAIVPPPAEPTDNQAALLALITMDSTGEPIRAQPPGVDIAGLLPNASDSAWLESTRPASFRATSQGAEELLYTTVPVADAPITVLGVWDADADKARLGRDNLVPAGLFPALMWLACLLVAVMAVNTLVIRHIRRLQREMSEFANNRKLPDPGGRAKMPAELAEVHARFADLSDDTLREEARLEEMLREKNVLLKEVHHRVKNNLQTIASIMNMQIRGAEHPETAENLQKIQNRVTSLAAIHRDLYDADHGGLVNVGALVRDTVQRSMEIVKNEPAELELKMDISEVVLIPDQAVPLSLLATEALTNALRAVAGRGGKPPVLKITLKEDGQTCTLEICNTIADADRTVDAGLGSRLIRAFAIQLGGDLETVIKDGTYVIRIAFKMQKTAPEAVDF